MRPARPVHCGPCKGPRSGPCSGPPAGLTTGPPTGPRTGSRQSRLLWIALLATSALAQAESFTGKVVAVIDGDSISVMHNGRAEAIRLNGIDAPERGQAFGAAAKKHLSDLIFGKTVRVDVRSTDRYRRQVADVFLAAACVNHEMVRAGLAWWFRRYAPRDRKLQALEEEARDAKRGLWVEEEPVAPWSFRRAK